MRMAISSPNLAALGWRQGNLTNRLVFQSTLRTASTSRIHGIKGFKYSFPLRITPTSRCYSGKLSVGMVPRWTINLLSLWITMAISSWQILKVIEYYSLPIQANSFVIGVICPLAFVFLAYFVG